MTVVDAIRARAREAPGHPALLGERRTTYAELVAAFDAHARRLRAAGLREGDRCGLLARQGAGFVEAALGILAAGGCMVPIPDDSAGPVLADLARQAHLHALLSEADGFAWRPLPAVPVDAAGDRDFRALRPAYLRFTSGTTRARKGVVIGHDAILARLDAANRALGIGPEDRILWVLPMAHHFVVSILLYLRFGATVLLAGRTLARPMLELASRERATVLYGSPFHFHLLAADTGERRLEDVRLALSTAEALRPDTARRFRERFGFPLGQALGIIEVGLPVLCPRLRADAPHTLGRPLPDYDVWLRGEDGQPVLGATSPEKSGEICIRGPGLFDAYLSPWTPAREILEPDGFRTGDQGYWSARGELCLAGRRANRINMAGIKFFSEEVEAVIDLHPGVRRSRVFARAHSHLGEIPVAEFVPADPARIPDRAALVAYCRERLPPYKIPREFRPVASLPVTPTGKLARGDPPSGGTS